MIAEKKFFGRSFRINDKKALKQFSALFSTNIISIGLGVLVSIVNTRLLGPEGYGDFKYLYDLFTLLVIFTTLGFPYTGSRIIALNENEEKKEQLIGGIYVITFITSLIYVGLVLLISVFIDNIYSGSVRHLILMYSPLLFVFSFYDLQPRLLEGENRIYDLSIYNTAHRVFYICFIAVAYYYTVVNLELALGLHLASYLLMLSFIFFKKLPDFSDLKNNLKILYNENKKHGIHIYLGSIFGKSTGYLGSLSIGYYLNNESVAFYALAFTVSSPLLMVPKTLGSIYFKKFANSNRIPSKIFIVTLLISSLTLVVFNLIVEYLILFVYTEEFLPVVQYTRIVSLAIVIQGFALFINGFLNSKGLGKELLNSSLIRGSIYIFGFLILVKFYGIYGACYTLVLANTVILFYLVLHYRRFLKAQYILKNDN